MRLTLRALSRNPIQRPSRVLVSSCSSNHDIFIHSHPSLMVRVRQKYPWNIANEGRLHSLEWFLMNVSYAGWYISPANGHMALTRVAGEKGAFPSGHWGGGVYIYVILKDKNTDWWAFFLRMPESPSDRLCKCPPWEWVLPSGDCKNHIQGLSLLMPRNLQFSFWIRIFK